MARNFKFAFPLPSRKNSEESQRALYEAPDSPWFNPGIKAERVLGTSEPNVESKKKLSRKDKVLQNHPSSISITISEGSGNSLRESDAGAKRQSERLRNQPSSPLLGHQYFNDSPDWDNRTDFSGLQPHRSQSSSTLRSYYDSSKSPLYISQQTSASSARDMALRKGYPPITSPQSQVALEAAVTPGAQDDSNLAEASKGTPMHLDLSTLFPTPYALDRAIISPSKVVRSTSSISMDSSNPHSAPIRPRWFNWERKRSKDSTPSDVAASLQRLPSVDGGTQTQVVRTAKDTKRASQTWYEGIQEEESFPEGCQQESFQESLQGCRSENDGALLKVGRDYFSRNHHQTKSKSDATQSRKPSHQTPKIRLDRTFAPCDHSRSRQSSLTNGTKGTSSNGSQKSVRWEVDEKVALSGDYLQNQSFLNLSSSDDEVDETPLSELRYRRHRIRASIETTDTGDEVQFCSAERIKTIKPRPIVNVPRRRNPIFKSVEAIPSVPSITMRPQLSPRVSSMRWGDDMKILPADEVVKATSGHSRDSSTASHSASQITFSDSRNEFPVSSSKMMAVTEDEEKLLEAMRRKRADLRRNFLSGNERDSRSMRQRTCSPRPRTAGEDGRTRSSYFNPNRSPSPPPLVHTHVRFLNGSPYASSAGDLSREESSLSSESLSFSKITTRTKSAPKPALPNLNFTPSDILPSSPTSRTSPLTPPPDHDSLEIYESGIAVSHSPPVLYLNKSKHDRKRTISSGIIVLDGAEQNARQLDEENEIAGWAMDRW
ncbi:hypothetical protein MMC07_008298 [Pseudocyphellaria aurata]|nr:hypothetical protein [Pseudocyphellaria aurata]